MAHSEWRAPVVSSSSSSWRRSRGSSSTGAPRWGLQLPQGRQEALQSPSRFARRRRGGIHVSIREHHGIFTTAAARQPPQTPRQQRPNNKTSSRRDTALAKTETSTTCPWLTAAAPTAAAATFAATTTLAATRAGLPRPRGHPSRRRRRSRLLVLLLLPRVSSSAGMTLFCRLGTRGSLWNEPWVISTRCSCYPGRGPATFGGGASTHT